MHPSDTIVAISSAVGPAARIIVRVSGARAHAIAREIGCGAATLEAPSVGTAGLNIRALRFPSWIYAFRSPRSYTGEDVVEFHVPGSPLLATMLLEELVGRGARQAEAGEFTARAYFNGRISLAEAEGVAAAIAAHSERELRAARQLMAGELARRLRPASELLAETLALLEAGIDFSDQDVSFLSQAELYDRIIRCDKELEQLISKSGRFASLSHEPELVLVGRPNAGKSTLLNKLAGQERAVVSPDAGTTRDAIWTHVRLRRGFVRMIDVAGISEPGSTGPSAAREEVEAKMRRAAIRTIQSADLRILVLDCTDERPPLPMQLPEPIRPDLTVLTKFDLAPACEARCCEPDTILVSAKTGLNLEALRDRLDALAFGAAGGGGATLALNARHLEAIDDARAALARARDLAQTAAAGPELMAMELRDALDAVGRVLGDITPDDVLGRIFAGFCIGK